MSFQLLSTIKVKLVDLMDVLEQRKHEAILFTFKQVSSELPSYLKPQKKLLTYA